MSSDRIFLVNNNGTGDAISAGLNDLNTSFLADVPAITIGILGFAVAKLLYAFNGMTRPSVLILLSVLCAFLAATFDSVRIFQTSNEAGDAATRALLIVQEPCLALSIFIRYLFFLEYATRSPDHTGTKNPRWSEWPIPRIVCEAILLLAAVAIVALQMMWRFGIAGWRRLCVADAALEIGWTTLLLLKMGCSIATCSDPAKRRKFAKALFPIMTALLIELGIAIGNTASRGFADRPTGRFLQAVEVYIILFALTGQALSRLLTQRARTLTGMSEKAAGSKIEVCLSRNPSAARSAYGTDDGLSRGPSLRDWLATRLPREADLEKQQLPNEGVPVRPPGVVHVQWPQSVHERTESSGTSNSIQPSPSQALAVIARHIVDPTPARASRVGSMPPPTPAPQGPLPAAPTRESAVPVDMDTRPVSSTFGHATTPRCSGLRTDSGASRANRCASAPAITATDASDAQSPRVLRAASNPGVARGAEALLRAREKDELAAAYADARRSVVSVATASVAHTCESDETYRPQSRTARESMSSEFSLSRFPAPPRASLAPPLPTRDTMPSRLTVDTDPRRLTFGLPSSSRPTSSATERDTRSVVATQSAPVLAVQPVPVSAVEPESASALSLAPSPPNLPRAPPRIRRKRTAESFATLAEPPPPVSMREPPPAANALFFGHPSRAPGPQRVRLPVGVASPVRIVHGLPVTQRLPQPRLGH